MATDDSRRRLNAVPFFSSLAPDELERVVTQAAVVSAGPGEVLIREGEIGDRMFVIESGSVQVYTTGFDASDVVLARLEAGQWFGEQALLPGGTWRRNASVRAVEGSRLLAISKEALLEALDHHSDLLRELRAADEEQRILRRSRLTESVFASLGVAVGGETYRFEEFAAGEVVFEQGARGDRVYLILDGRAEVKRRENGTQTVLAQLLSGQFFGELAILHDAPRAATVQAIDDLKTVSLDGEWFRAAIRETPALRSLMDSLESMYLLPQRGLVTLQTGHVEGRRTLTAVHTLPDGRRVVSTRLVESAAFTSRVLDVTAPQTDVQFERPASGVYRALGIADGRIVELHAEGEWTRLGAMLGLLLDGTPVEEWQLALFRERGEFSAEDPRPLYADAEEICACTHATCGQIQQAITDGCHTLETVAQRTRATMVCGGCAPLVKELLGDAAWTAARVADTIPLTDDIRTFRIRPASGVCPTHLPGQHVVLQARIDNRWVQRAYTLSSAPGTGDAYEVTMKREPQGVFSRWFFDRLRSDALLRVSEPAGHYYLADDETRDVVCLVAGIGVTPALAIARALAARPRPIKLHVDYSVSTKAQAICHEELSSLPRKNPNVSVRVRHTREEGRFNAADARDLVQRVPGAVFYLCGGDAYLETVAGYLREAGVADDRIRIEVFTVAGEKPVGQPGAATGCPVAHSATGGAPPATPIDQAKDFLRQYYAETKAPSVFELRWRQVEDEFRTTGTYRQTAEELSYAARLAWRNSTRCVGRLYWEGLAFRDFRHVTTGEEMLDAIMGHIEIATNGGSLRPVITVFPPRDANGVAPRVWSPQFFRYAGYASPDGSVLGDPANVELTQVAQSLGWRPPEPRSAFDLLPIIVQAVGGRPTWREIPRSLILEIPIVHPDFAWFTDLGLKWYALPAVSSMLFDAGGVQYPAAPFNGWYMGTEIGARNFGDTSRYNLLPVVAQRMGLDTASDRKLWRDRAIVELNVAVLYSYERAGVTMIDHHAASQAFDKFEALETQAGREVHARWSWIVPPISGSAVTVFHREWQDIELTPIYRAQPDAWKDDESWRQARSGHTGG